MTEITITIEDDGTFSVDQETAQQEAAEQEPASETEQKFKTAAEALKAVAHMLAAMPGDEPSENEATEPAGADMMSAEANDADEKQGMMAGYAQGPRG